jgi:hypothetical protein
MLLKSRSPAMTATRIVSGPTLLTGICFCAGLWRSDAAAQARAAVNATTLVARKPARARQAVRVAPYPWKNSITW